jgi:hypothetical protein
MAAVVRPSSRGRHKHVFGLLLLLAALASCLVDQATASQSLRLKNGENEMIVSKDVANLGGIHHGHHHDHRRDHDDVSKNQRRTDAFVKGLKFKHRLRVCNAYPNVEKLDVYLGGKDAKDGGEKLTKDEPLDYKNCREFRAPLSSGDTLEFKMKDASAGSFTVSDLPNNNAVLFLVILRHDTMSTAVSFQSHVFANLLNAQVAVMDTYKGKAIVHPSIRDAEDSGGGKGRKEDLRFNSVVAVNPGRFEVDLLGLDGEKKAKSELVALNRESYVVIRVGTEPQKGENYPQELIIFPKSDPKMLPSAAVTSAPIGFVVLLSALVATFAV